jgi:glutamyl-tRNA synthetase
VARHAGGKFLLRIEDTDLARSTEQATHQLLDDLRWLGLHWDNAQLVHQSKRTGVYNAAVDDLIRRGLAYKAYETLQELEEMRRQAEREKRAYIYRRRELTDEQMRRHEAEGRAHVVRFAMPVKEHRFRDAVLDKEVVLGADQVQDFVIRKTDGMPTFHFAVVVDDAEMGVTHVLRGQEHLLNTVNHVAIQEALGYPRPVYGHLPIILNIDGSKMGKRDRDKKIRHHANLWLRNRRSAGADLAQAAGLDEQRIMDWLVDDSQQLDIDEQRAVMQVVGLKESDLPEILVHDFRRNGYLPEVLLSFLALLGWSPGGDKERMSVEEMMRLFSMEDIGKSNAKFDREKLLAFNTEACGAATPQRLLAAMRDYLSVNPGSPLNGADDAALARVLRIKPGFHILREVEEQSRFFFLSDEQIVYDAEAVEKVLRKNAGQGAAALREIRQVLAGAGEWTAGGLEAAVKQYCDSKQLGLGKVAQPIRVAICGTTISPPIFQSLEFLGKTRTLGRIERCLAAVG